MQAQLSVAESYERDHARYVAYYNAEAERVVAEWDLPIEHANLFAHAQAMQRDRGDNDGVVRPETIDFANVQNRQRTLESIGQPFATTFDFYFDGVDLRDQRGEAELPARLRGVLGAKALELAKPEFAFYTRRSIYEFGTKTLEIDMMKHAPVGTVIGLVSPCHDVPHLAKQLGMLPSRDMAIVQLSYKKSETHMGMAIYSLDGADDELLVPLLRFYGLEIPAGTARADYLGQRFSGYAESPAELQAKYVAPGIQFFDELATARAGQPTRQGQTGDKLEDVEGRFMRECTKAQTAQLRMDEALSWVMGDEPVVLPQFLRAFGQQAVNKIRNDGKPMLSSNEKSLIHNLLNQGAVTANDATHAEALRIIKRVHETAVDDAVWRYFGGDAQALNELDRVEELISSASDAAEAGRFSEGCGSESSFGAQDTEQACDFTVKGQSPCCGKYGMIFHSENGVTTCRGCGSFKNRYFTYLAPGAKKDASADKPKTSTAEKSAEATRKTSQERRRSGKLAEGAIQIVSGRAFKVHHVLVVGGTRLALIDVQTSAELVP